MIRSILLTLCLAFAGIGPSHAANDPILAEATDLLGSVMFLNSGAPCMVLVVVRGDSTLFRFYGETEKGNKRPPDGTSLLRLNSLTKVFTTEVLVSLVADGKLALTDPLQRFAGDVRVPIFGMRSITLLDLATHSAALPREMGDVPEGREPTSVAHAPGAMGMAARLHAALGPRQHRCLFERWVRSTSRCDRGSRRSALSRTAAVKSHRTARDDRYWLRAHPGAMRQADRRHRNRRTCTMRRHACDGGQRRPLQHGR